jgi:futalosine hydrolase
VGDVVSRRLKAGDLGATSPSGFLDMKALGFPVVEAPVPLFNELPMQVFPVERRVRFVTMTTCTGTDSEARAIERRTGGAVENMEGAAVAHVAHLHGVPAGEVRGISNLVTDRDTRAWRLRGGARRQGPSRGSRAAEPPSRPAERHLFHALVMGSSQAPVILHR